MSLCVLLVWVTSTLDWFSHIRFKLLSTVTPLLWVMDKPEELWLWTQNKWVSHQQLLQQNAELRKQIQVLNYRLITMNTLLAENEQLNQLLHTTIVQKYDILVAKLIGIIPGYHGHRVIINRGSQDGVFVGQPVFNQSEPYGQVILLGSQSSEILLISDRSHALPVNSLRNGYRTIAEGMGNFDYLQIKNIPRTADIKEGDLFATSGLGMRFPQGYIIGKVISLSFMPDNAKLLQARLSIDSNNRDARQLFLLNNYELAHPKHN